MKETVHVTGTCDPESARTAAEALVSDNTRLFLEGADLMILFCCLGKTRAGSEIVTNRDGCRSLYETNALSCRGRCAAGVASIEVM